MPSEPAKIMKKVYDDLIIASKVNSTITVDEEARIIAQIQIKYGLTKHKALQMMDNLMKTGHYYRTAKVV